MGVKFEGGDELRRTGSCEEVALHLSRPYCRRDLDTVMIASSSVSAMDAVSLWRRKWTVSSFRACMLVVEPSLGFEGNTDGEYNKFCARRSCMFGISR